MWLQTCLRTVWEELILKLSNKQDIRFVITTQTMEEERASTWGLPASLFWKLCHRWADFLCRISGSTQEAVLEHIQSVCNVLQQFPGWTTHFLETVCNGIWGTFSLIWWVCQQQHVYKHHHIKKVMQCSVLVYTRCSTPGISCSII